MVREELSMRNPLNKRLPRELKHDFGKYLVIFLFMVMMISLVSGFLVADNSVKHSYDEGYDDIYMDGDYDYDRYDRDSDYADGVDDAMDEFDEDW